MDRLKLDPHEKSHAYSSTMFGDPATIIPQGYLGDPTKFRVVHGGAELFHIYHLHGGGDRWRANPEATRPTTTSTPACTRSPSRSPALIVSTRSTPARARASTPRSKAAQAACSRLRATSCSTATSPSTTRRACGASGECSTHCSPVLHPARPCRLRAAVTSAELIGRQMPDGTILTKDNLACWINPQFPPQGIAIGNEDATVWDWTVDNTDPEAPLYLGEPEPTFAQTPNFTEGVAGHFGSRAGDLFLGNRPEILFNPSNGRPAFPMMRPHFERRPPFAPNLHSGAPWLGETADLPADPDSADSSLGRPDGLCPPTRP